MQSPNDLRDSSQPTLSRPSSSPSSSQHYSSTRSPSTRPPRSNPHSHLLTRTVSRCPTTLIDSQRTHWFKAADKAKRNATLTRELPPFQYSTINYGEPIFIHHSTPHSIIQSLLQQLRAVTIYVVDTENDPSTQFHPEPSLALVQIQAIHNETLSNILLIETQFLPYPSSPTFLLIQQLCQLIFSSNNYIVTWGDVLRELSTLQQFGLFDPSQLRHPLNLQLYFTNQWNHTHPHASDCSIQPPPIHNDSDYDVDLICGVDSSDIADLLFPQPVVKHKPKIQCTCPNDIRPYKSDNEQWSLQRAISSTFNEALNKTHTMNVWSCGLDPQLTTNVLSHSIATRAAMTLYAVNDVLAPARLLFHLDHDIIRHCRSRTSSTPTFTSPTAQPTTDPPHSTNLSSSLPSYLVISDSHARYLDPSIKTELYQLHVHAISGLKWRDDKQPRLCAHSLIYSNLFSPSLINATAILFLIGTNSIRFTDAAQVIQQVAYIINYIQQHYPHLNKKPNISVVAAFPCNKTTSSFPSSSSLSSNITLYNDVLQTLSTTLNFTVLDFKIQPFHLADDQMHLHKDHRDLILRSITTHFTNLAQPLVSLHPISKRSKTSSTRRNKIRHEKMAQKRKNFTIKRPIAILWKPKHIKHVLELYHLKPARILEVHHHNITIQFNNLDDRDTADVSLPDDIFNLEHFHQYFP